MDFLNNSELITLAHELGIETAIPRIARERLEEDIMRNATQKMGHDELRAYYAAIADSAGVDIPTFLRFVDEVTTDMVCGIS
jgi:hypothetical protein